MLLVLVKSNTLMCRRIAHIVVTRNIFLQFDALIFTNSVGILHTQFFKWA